MHNDLAAQCQEKSKRVNPSGFPRGWKQRPVTGVCHYNSGESGSDSRLSAGAEPDPGRSSPIGQSLAATTDSGLSQPGTKTHLSPTAKRGAGMSYAAPTFNLSCNIWYGAGVIPPSGDPDVSDQRCQLRMLKTVFGTLANTQTTRMFLLLPARTDINGRISGAGYLGDVVEVPADTGRYYQVNAVDDVARGFANEYRVAVIQQRGDIPGGWPIPTT